MNDEKLRKIIDCLCQQINNCQDCREYFNMPYHICCLYTCHEYEFFSGCCDDCGTHHEDFKDFVERYEDSNSRSMEL